MDKADKEIAAVAAFLFCTGLRPISVVSIHKEQLMLSAAHPYVRNVYLKGGKRYDVVILYPNIVLPLLRWYLQFKSQKIENYDKIPYVFISQQLKSRSTAYIYFLIRRWRAVKNSNIS
jgi:integrase